MNTKILTKLEPSLIGLGDRAHTVVLLKTFLKAHPNIPTANLKINNSYDKETRDAIAYVQKNKGLTPTGRMAPDTWMALGTESNPIQIKGLFASERIIQSLMGAGYLLKHPTARKAKVTNSVIQTSSTKQPGADDYWYDFTFLVYVTVFAPFDWFGDRSVCQPAIKEIVDLERIGQPATGCNVFRPLPPHPARGHTIGSWIGNGQ